MTYEQITKLTEHQIIKLLKDNESVDHVSLIDSKNDFFMIGFYKSNDLKYVNIYKTDQYTGKRLGYVGEAAFVIKNFNFDSDHFYQVVNNVFDTVLGY